MADTVEDILGPDLTEEAKKAAMLSTLMYFDDMYYEPGKTLAENISNMKDNHTTEYYDMLDEGYAGLTYEEAEDFLNYIASDPELGNLIVKDINNRDYANNINKIETGSVQGCFVNPETNEAIFAFKGTNTAEWIDNAYAFFGILSPEQQAAVDYVKSKVEEYNLQDYAIDVTGHSKGGNEAKLVTLMCDFVRNCFSFDGQGESPEILSRDDVHLENADKIVNICADNDYVNSWGISVGNKIYVESDCSGPGAHNLAALCTIDSDGNLLFNNPTGPSEATKWMCQVSDDLMQLPADERGEIAKAVMTLVQGVKGIEYIYANGYPDVATIYEDAGLTKETLDKAIDFLVENGHVSDGLSRVVEDVMPDKVSDEFVNMIPDSAYDSVSKAIGALLETPLVDELVSNTLGSIMAGVKLGDADNVFDQNKILGDTIQQITLGSTIDTMQGLQSTVWEVPSHLIEFMQDVSRAKTDFDQNLAGYVVNEALINANDAVNQNQNRINNGIDAMQARSGLSNGIAGLVIDGLQTISNNLVDGAQNKTIDDVNSLKEEFNKGVDFAQDISEMPVDGIQFLYNSVVGGVDGISRQVVDKGQEGLNLVYDLGQKGLSWSFNLGQKLGAKVAGYINQNSQGVLHTPNGMSNIKNTVTPNVIPTPTPDIIVEPIPNATPGAVIEPIPNATPGMGTVIPLNMSNEYGSNMTNTMAGYSALINQKKEENAINNSPVNNMQEQDKGKTSAPKDDRGI